MRQSGLVVKSTISHRLVERVTVRDGLPELPQLITTQGVIIPSVGERAVSATSSVCNQISVLHCRVSPPFRRGGLDGLMVYVPRTPCEAKAPPQGSRLRAHRFSWASGYRRWLCVKSGTMPGRRRRNGPPPPVTETCGADERPIKKMPHGLSAASLPCCL